MADIIRERTKRIIQHNQRSDVRRAPPKRPNDFSGSRYYASFNESILDDNTYTGTAGEDVVFPPAIAHYLLVEIGFGSVTSYITTGASTFGSFANANTDINGLVGGDWEIIARYTTEPTTIREAIRGMEAQAPFTTWRSTLDNKMKCEVYKETPDSHDRFTDFTGAAYSWSYKEDMIEGSVRVTMSPLEEIINEVHVKHALYAPSGEYTRDAWVGPSGSDNGSGTADENGAGDRKDQASESVTQFGIKRAITVSADQIYLPAVAVALRNKMFDRFHRPRILVTFDTWGRATTMDLNMVTSLANDLTDFCQVPKYPYGGAAVEWNDIEFYVRLKSLFNDNGRIRHRVTLEEIPQVL